MAQMERAEPKVPAVLTASVLPVANVPLAEHALQAAHAGQAVETTARLAGCCRDFAQLLE